MKRILLFLLLATGCMSVSAREYLIQTEWAQENIQTLPKFSDGNPVYAGCTTIAAAQVINYYGWLPEYDTNYKIDVTVPLSGWPEGAVEKKSEEYSYWYWCGTYHGTAMPCSKDSLIATLFYSEANHIEALGTSTSPWLLYGAFMNHYSYDVEAYVTNEYSDASELIFCQIVTTEAQKEIVKNAILAQKPVIVNGKAHTFILDGYDAETDEFHFNLGWGAGQNYWGDFRSWADGRYSVYIVTPNKEKVAMPEIAVSDSIPFHFRNVDTGIDHIGYLSSDINNYIEFEDYFDDQVSPGSYEIWFEFPDGTILAPQLPNDRKSFADGQEGVVAYSFKNTPAMLYIDDRENYGFMLHASIYYDTRSGYFNIQYGEYLSTEGMAQGDLTVVCNGLTYKISKHKRDYYTIPIRLAAGDTVEWLAYVKDMPYGNTSNSFYQDAIEFEMNGYTLTIDTAHVDGPNDYHANFVNNDNKDYKVSSQCAGLGLFNSTNPFKFVVPTEVYAKTGTGDVEKLTPKYLYMGILFDRYGAYMFVYNKMPPTDTLETGVIFVVDDEQTAIALEPGSLVPTPETPTKAGYTFVGWDPVLTEGAVVPNGVVEYYAMFEENQGEDPGDNPGGDNPGGDNPGGDDPGNNPGGDVDFPTMTITYDEASNQLSFKPSDVNAYYLWTAYPEDILETYQIDPDTYHSELVASCSSWESLITTFQAFGIDVFQGNLVVDMSSSHERGWDGTDWLAFANFVDPATLAVSQSTKYSFDVPELTGIDEVNAAKNVQKPIYDLQGRKVTAMKPGQIYLIGGKKYLQQ